MSKRPVKVWPGDYDRKRHAQLKQLADVPRTPLWLKILAFAMILFFAYLLVTWAIWSMQTVVIPRFRS